MMNRRELETLLLTLESTPLLLAKASEGLHPSQTRRRPAGGGFSFVENVWHLADLEREGFAVRIRRILTEEDPSLSNFDGDRVARERDYQSRDAATGIEVFTGARRRNVEILRSIQAGDWKRGGVQDGVGPLVLADVPRRMAEHDRSHTSDVAALLEEVSRDDATQPAPQAAMHRLAFGRDIRFANGGRESASLRTMREPGADGGRWTF